MKKLQYIFIAMTLFTSYSFTYGQSLDEKYLDKVNSIDSTIKTLYDVISGEKGEERNWELMKYLYHPAGRLAATGRKQNGDIGVMTLTPEDYEKNSGPWLVENGFFEREIHRKVEQFGNIAHAFSTYESFHSLNDKEPFMRGINSIQLLYNGKRWFVVNIFWAQESNENPIPDKYLP